MKQLSMFGIIGGAALLIAAPFSLQWSQKRAECTCRRHDRQVALCAFDPTAAGHLPETSDEDCPIA